VGTKGQTKVLGTSYCFYKNIWEMLEKEKKKEKKITSRCNKKMGIKVKTAKITIAATCHLKIIPENVKANPTIVARTK